MSGLTATDLSMQLPLDSGKINGKSINGILAKSCTQNDHRDNISSFPTCVKPDAPNEHNATKDGSNSANSEIEYVESENLTELPSLEFCLSTLIERLDSKDWISVCESLNNVRQISIYHKDGLLEMLDSVLTSLVKALKNPRSAVCKTAIMASADIFKAYGDCIVDSFDPLLLQLLLKSSQDKKFVCEAAEKALVSLTSWVTPSLLLPKLQPYLKHKNPRVRAKASICFSRSVSHLQMDGVRSYGIDKLIQVAASQITDQLPESREAARILAVELQKVYEKTCILTSKAEEQTMTSEDPEQAVLKNTWEDFCNTNLSPLSAQAIIRVTSVVKEDQVASC